jgi:hypothetical protein
MKMRDFDINTKIYSIMEILKKVKDGSIILDNEESLDINKASFIIIQIFSHMPLPNIYSENAGNNEIHVLNSKVLDAINRYVNNEFALDSIVEDFNGLKYEDLTPQYKRRIMEAKITSYEILNYKHTCDDCIKMIRLCYNI